MQGSKILTSYELMTLKPLLKRLGYKTKIKHYSEFSVCKVEHIATKEIINDGNVFSPEYLAKHSEAFKLINQYKTMILK